MPLNPKSEIRNSKSAIHVAILHRQYLQLILSGRKTIESRLTVRPLVPYRAIAPGDVIYFKASSGPYMAKARADLVLFFDNLTPARIRELQTQYNHEICGDDAYWQWKQTSRFASLIRLADVQPTSQGPVLAPSTGPAWFVVKPATMPTPAISSASMPSQSSKSSSAANPSKGNQPRLTLHTTLTAGALRNHYLRAPRGIKGDVTLLMPTGQTLRTTVTSKGIFKHRRWAKLLTSTSLEPGSQVRFEEIEPGTYRVTLLSDGNPSTSPQHHQAHATQTCAPVKSTVPLLTDFIGKAKLKVLLNLAQREDLGSAHEDVTSQLLIPARLQTKALLRSRVEGCLSGAALLPMIAQLYDPSIRVEVHLADGSALKPGDIVATCNGPLRSILAMERVALNFCTHLSGIATLTHQYVQLVQGSKAAICDTRKTIPGLRELAKYAVVCGGGQSHRMGLFDAVLVKDNHLAHLSIDEFQPALMKMLMQARKRKPPLKFTEVEVDTLEQLKMVLPCQPDIVLLDNMPPASLRTAVAMRDQFARNLLPASKQHHVLLEASGGVNLGTVRDIAKTGVDRISVGAITHSAPALDLGLDIEP